ncbi:Flp pilus assembly complex ATPase component TadA, partial [bacterium]|nr:Flp pilus assembly complex ATPase component TadA [bacterium]
MGLDLPERLAQLTEKLQGNSAFDAEQALESCKEIDDERFLLILAYKGLAHSTHGVQKKSAEILGKHGSKISDLLLTLLNHPQESIRYWSIELLGNMGKLTFETLSSILDKQEKDGIKILVADLVNKSQEAEVVPTLIRHLGDSSWTFRRHINKLLRDRGETVVPSIGSVFSTGNINQKYWALKLLMEISGPRGIDYIKKFLASPDLSVRSYAVAALEFIQEPDPAPILIKTLSEPSPVLRYQAGKVLSKKGETAIKEIWPLVKTAGPDLKNDLLKISGKILGSKSRGSMKSLLESPNPDERFYALTALGQSPDVEGIKTLIQAFHDPVWVIRSHASDLLSRLGPRVTDYLINSLNDKDLDTLYWVTKTLGESGDTNAVRSLLNIIDHHPDPTAKTYAISAICRLNIEYIVELLILNFRDPALSVRNSIVDGLSSMERKRVIKPLLIYLFDKDKTLSFWSEKTLKKLKYLALPSVLEMVVTLDPQQLERFTRDLHQLKSEQLETLLSREKVVLDDFDPENLEEETVSAVELTDYRDIQDLLLQVREQHGSDLHINVGLPPMIRIHGELVRLNLPPISEEKSSQLLSQTLNEEQTNKFKDKWEIDFSYEVKHVGRFRVNLFKQRQGMSGVFRIIPTQIPTFEELELDRHIFEGIAENRNGLILVTGPTGSGKSTTMAGMVDAINRTRYEHILTIEDPIEFVHMHKRCSINQRELGAHTLSFSNALRSALREDPNVILVGE